MTTTFNHEEFYSKLKDVVLETIIRKHILFSLLPEQPDIIQRKDALLDMLTIFSFQESVILSSDPEKKGLDINIQTAINDFYRHTGDSEIVGVTPSERLLDELSDLAYIIQPKFPTQHFIDFVNDQGLDEEDKEDIVASSLSSIVIASILVVIKSEMLLIAVMENIGKGASKKSAKGGSKIDG